MDESAAPPLATVASPPSPASPTSEMEAAAPSPQPPPQDQKIPQSFLQPWLESLQAHRHEQADDFPNFFVSNPQQLATSCTPLSAQTGPGVSIFTDSLLPAIARAKHEIILVTCFWAESPTLAALGAALEKLAKARKEQPQKPAPLQVHIGFSSRSLLQKLFHTWSRRGSSYPPESWPGLGLPSATVLREGAVELTVKSLFFPPLSVMHPKFLVVDRQRAWMPSCNVSWEAWFETCIEFEGPAVKVLVDFYRNTWAYGGSGKISPPPADPAEDGADAGSTSAVAAAGGFRQSLRRNYATNHRRFENLGPCPAVLLPSSHHRNPRFRPWPLGDAVPPTTPLNAALLTLFEQAQEHIEITTPNLTCWAVISSLLAALGRGVDVTIRTSRNMMVVEQLVTAGTTTAWALRSMVRRYRALRDSASSRVVGDSESQAASLQPGQLTILMYRPDAEATMAGDRDEPVLLHMKMTRVDGEYLVLGSGNMDRASWFTSQELGILLYVPGLDMDVWSKPLETRLEVVFPK